jgi:hypothetical protein
VYMWQMVFVFLLSRLSAGLDGPPTDTICHINTDGLQMGPKHVEAR